MQRRELWANLRIAGLTVLLAMATATLLVLVLRYTAGANDSENEDRGVQVMVPDPLLASIPGRRGARLAKQQARINAELASLSDHHWAGVYMSPSVAYDALSIRLAPEAGVIALGSSCVGTFVHGDGEVEIDPDGALRLVFSEAGQSSSPSELPIRWWPVSWGERRLLIADDWMEDFIQEVCEGVAGTELALWTHLVSAEAPEAPVFGRPVLPTLHDHRLPLNFLPNGRVQLGATCPENP